MRRLLLIFLLFVLIVNSCFSLESVISSYVVLKNENGEIRFIIGVIPFKFQNDIGESQIKNSLKASPLFRQKKALWIQIVSTIK